MDERYREIFQKIGNEGIVSLLVGISDFFKLKFPPENYGDRHCLNEQGYMFSYLKREYEMNFYQPPGENIRFILKTSREGIEDKIKETTSRTQLEESRYLSKKKVKLNENYIEITCRLKRYPKDQSTVSEICKEIWGNIIRPLLLK